MAAPPSPTRSFGDDTSDALSSSGESEESVERRAGARRSRQPLNRLRGAVQKVIHLSHTGPARNRHEHLQRLRLLDGSHLTDQKEQAFASEVFTSGALMLASSRILRRLYRKLEALGWTSAGPCKEMVQGLLAQAVYQSKRCTLRHCWLERVQPAEHKLRDLREHHESLKEQFKTARSDYLREITTLRDQLRPRKDADVAQQKLKDIISFYDPSLALEPSELLFLCQAVSEKVKMIFETNPGAPQSCNLVQLEHMLQRRDVKEVSELKAALKRSSEEVQSLREYAAGLEADIKVRRLATRTLPAKEVADEKREEAAEQAREEAMEEARQEAADYSTEEAVEEAAEEAQKVELPRSPFEEAESVAGAQERASTCGSFREQGELAVPDVDNLELKSEDGEYGDEEAADYFLLQRRFRRQQEACRVAQTIRKEKEAELESLQHQLAVVTGEKEELHRQLSRLRQAQALGCAEADSEQRTSDRARALGKRRATFPGAATAADFWNVKPKAGRPLDRGATCPIGAQGPRSEGPAAFLPVHSVFRRRARPLVPDDVDLGVQLDSVQGLFEELWACTTPSSGQAGRQRLTILRDKPLEPQPLSQLQQAASSNPEVEALTENLLRLLNGAEAQVWGLAKRCEELQTQNQAMRDTLEHYQRVFWDSTKDQVRRLSEEALEESGHLQKVTSLFERGLHKVVAGRLEDLQAELSTAQTHHQCARTGLRAELETGHACVTVDAAWLKRLEGARLQVISQKQRLKHAEMRYALARFEEVACFAQLCEEQVHSSPPRFGCRRCKEVDKVLGLLCTICDHSKELCSKFKDSAVENIHLVQAFDDLQTEVAGSAAALKESVFMVGDPGLCSILQTLEEAGRQTVYDRLCGGRRGLSERFLEQRLKYREDSNQLLLLHKKLVPQARGARMAQTLQDPPAAGMNPEDMDMGSTRRRLAALMGTRPGAHFPFEPQEQRSALCTPPAKKGRRVRESKEPAAANADPNLCVTLQALEEGHEKLMVEPQLQGGAGHRRRSTADAPGGEPRLQGPPAVSPTPAGRHHERLLPPAPAHPVRPESCGAIRAIYVLTPTLEEPAATSPRASPRPVSCASPRPSPRASPTALSSSGEVQALVGAATKRQQGSVYPPQMVSYDVPPKVQHAALRSQDTPEHPPGSPARKRPVAQPPVPNFSPSSRMSWTPKPATERGRGFAQATGELILRSAMRPGTAAGATGEGKGALG